MNMKVFYQKLRSVEETIAEQHPIVVSLETPDGGRAGVMTEAPRRLAARLIVEGKARIAGEDEAKAFREEVAEARRRAEEMTMADRVQLRVVTESEARRPGAGSKNPKS